MPDVSSFIAFLPTSPIEFFESIPSAIQTAFLPENITGTLIILAAIVVLFAVAFPLVRLILRVCTSLWQVVLLCIGLAFLGNLIMSGIAYSATVAGLLENAHIGIASDWIGLIAIVGGILIAYFTTPKRMRMF